MDLRPLIILPTYNEIENLPVLVPEVLATVPSASIVVVDDGSPDGTGAWVEQFAATDDRVHLVSRPTKMGLGTAYRAGWRWGMERGFDPLITMDADRSHRPGYLPEMLVRCETDADLVVGSRYVAGGGLRNWPLRRRILSRIANHVARTLLRLRTRDVTAGFRVYRAATLAMIDMDSIRAEGYSFLEEVLWRVERAGLRVAEVPIVFEDRTAGTSKIDHREVYRAMGTLLRLAFARWHGRTSHDAAAGASTDETPSGSNT